LFLLRSPWTKPSFRSRAAAPSTTVVTAWSYLATAGRAAQRVGRGNFPGFPSGGDHVLHPSVVSTEAPAKFGRWVLPRVVGLRSSVGAPEPHSPGQGRFQPPNVTSASLLVIYAFRSSPSLRRSPQRINGLPTFYRHFPAQPCPGSTSCPLLVEKSAANTIRQAGVFCSVPVR
jgi:hypothetical protein